MKFALCLIPFCLMLLVLIPVILGSQNTSPSSYVLCDGASVRLRSGVEISCFSVATPEPANGYWILFDRPQYDTAHLYSLSLSPKKIMCFYGTTEIMFLNTSSGWIVHDAQEKTDARPLSDRDSKFVDDCLDFCRVLDAAYHRHRVLSDAVEECFETINRFVMTTYRLRTLPPPPENTI